MPARLLLIAVVFAGALTVGQGATAQQASPLAAALVPSRLELALQPGGSESRVLQLVNKGDLALRALIRPAAIDLGELDDTYILDPRNVPVSAADWVRVDPQEVLVPPAQDRSVRVEISPPPDASLGSYQAVVFFDLLPAQQQPKEGAVALQARVGGMVLVDLIRPGAEPARKGEATNGRLEVRSHHLLDGWRPDPGALFASPNVRASADLRNTGSSYLIAVDTFKFHGGEGGRGNQRIGPLVIPQGTGHTFRSEWHRAQFLGSVSVDNELVYARGKEGLFTIPQTFDAWVIPWAQIEALLLLFALAAIMLRWRRWQRWRRALSRPGEHRAAPERQY